MANNLKQESCWEMVLYDHSEASGWRGSSNIVYDAKPLSCYLPAEEEWGTVEEAIGLGGKPIKAVPISCVPPKEEVLDDGSGRKRKRSEFVGQIQKDFTLPEIFQTGNIQEIIKNRETAECTLDSQQILQKLKGWTIVTHRRQGKGRLDKVYRHPTSKTLRSVIQVQKFIVESSYIKKAAYNAEGGPVQEAVGSQVQSLATRPLASDKRNIYLEIYQRLGDFFNPGTNPS